MTSSPETVSAVIIAYNSAPFLRDAIESVLNQTRPIDEIVVVDDGSTDATAEIATSYSSRGVRYIFQANQGCAGARNTGINATTGQFVGVLDADDIWLPDKTERQLAAFAIHPQAAMVSGNKIWWDLDENTRRPFFYDTVERANVKRDILVSNCVGNPSMTLIRRSVFGEVGLFDPAMIYGDDWEFWIRIIERHDVAFIADPVIIYRWHSSNLSQRNQAARLNSLKRLATRAIWRSQPVWRRPFAHLRILSKTELQLAVLAGHDAAYWRQLRHAATAFATYPSDQFGVKAIRLIRAVIGPSAYQAIKARLQAADRLETRVG